LGGIDLNAFVLLGKTLMDFVTSVTAMNTNGSLKRVSPGGVEQYRAGLASAEIFASAFKSKLRPQVPRLADYRSFI
jgi:hypothetical protein